MALKPGSPINTSIIFLSALKIPALASLPPRVPAITQLRGYLTHAWIAHRGTDLGTEKKKKTWRLWISVGKKYRQRWYKRLGKREKEECGEGGGRRELGGTERERKRRSPPATIKKRKTMRSHSLVAPTSAPLFAVFACVLSYSCLDYTLGFIPHFIFSLGGTNIWRS